MNKFIILEFQKFKCMFQLKIFWIKNDSSFKFHLSIKSLNFENFF